MFLTRHNIPFTFNAPGDGNVIVEALQGEGNPNDFTVNLTGNGASTPEPATVGVVGIGLGAVALAWRRRRAQ